MIIRIILLMIIVIVRTLLDRSVRNIITVLVLSLFKTEV